MSAFMAASGWPHAGWPQVQAPDFKLCWHVGPTGLPQSWHQLVLQQHPKPAGPSTLASYTKAQSWHAEAQLARRAAVLRPAWCVLQPNTKGPVSAC